MLVVIVVTWICIRLDAPAWCFVLLWLFTILNIVYYVINFLKDKKRKGRS